MKAGILGQKQQPLIRRNSERPRESYLNSRLYLARACRMVPVVRFSGRYCRHSLCPEQYTALSQQPSGCHRSVQQCLAPVVRLLSNTSNPANLRSIGSAQTQIFPIERFSQIWQPAGFLKSVSSDLQLNHPAVPGTGPTI